MSLLIILLLTVCTIPSAAQNSNQKTNSDPFKAEFITSDIDNFWRAFDLAAKETDREKKIAIYQTEYLDKGSVGLKDFVRMRIKSADELVKAAAAQEHIHQTGDQ